jgi:hypothetical protein
MDEPIEVECQQVEGGPRFAIVLGKKGKTKGLWLCDDWASCFLVERGRYEDIAEHLRYTALHFGGRREISLDDLEKARRFGFEVAGPRAYPLALRKEPGKGFRSPDAGELELLEACLWVIPDFLKRAEDRKPGLYEYAFKGMIGKRQPMPAVWDDPKVHRHVTDKKDDSSGKVIPPAVTQLVWAGPSNDEVERMLKISATRDA